MACLEAIIYAPLSFRRDTAGVIGDYDRPPETVSIDFDGREFVWHAFSEPDRILGILGPTVTTLLGSEGGEVEATELERLLSALTFLYDVPTAVAHHGSSSSDDPHAEPYARGPLAPGWTRKPPPVSLKLRRDSDGLLKALGWYREGRCSESPYFRFVAHWNALEAVYYGPTSRAGRAKFLDRVTPTLSMAWSAWPLPSDPSGRFQNSSRDAIGHVYRGAGSRPLIDPDADSDRSRLDWEGRFLQLLVPHAIREVFEEPVDATWDERQHRGLGPRACRPFGPQIARG